MCLQETAVTELRPSWKLTAGGYSTAVATCRSIRKKVSGDDHWGLERPRRLPLRSVVSSDKCALGSGHMREIPFLSVCTSRKVVPWDSTGHPLYKVVKNYCLL